MNRAHIKRWWAPCTLVLLSFISVVTLPFVAYSDGASSWFYPWYNAKQLLYAWDTYGGIGHPAPNNLTGLTLRLFYSFCALFGRSPDLTQKTAWLIFLCGSSLYLYFLLMRLLKNQLAAFSLATLILINPISQYFLWGKQHWTYYLVLPYFIGTLINIEFFKHKKIYWAFLCSSIWLIFSFAYNQPAYFAPFVLIQLLLCLRYLIISEEKRNDFIVFVKGGLLFSIINAPFFLPLALGGVATINNVQSNYAGSDPLPILHDTENVRFLYSFFANTIGYGEFYLNNPWSYLLIFAIIVLLICPLVYIKRTREQYEDFSLYLIFIVLLFIFIFLMKGLTDPLPWLSLKIYSFKLMYIFRDYKDKFAIGMSTVICLGFLYILKLRESRFFISSMLLLALISWALFIGHTWFQFQKGYKSSSDLSYLSKIQLNQSNNYRVLNLPLVDYSFFYTNTPTYAADNPLKNILKHPVIYTTQTGDYTDVSIIKQGLDDNTLAPTIFYSFLKSYSVKYVLNNKNSYVKEQSMPWAYNYKTLSQYPFLRMVSNTRSYQLFEFNQFTPIISGNGISWHKVSNSEYIIHASGTTELDYLDTAGKSPQTGLLNLMEGISYLWRTPVFDKTHLPLSTFGNKWEINNSSKSYILYYRPQAYFDVGEALSFIALLGGGYVSYKSLKEIK
jgi:hypothetical protein